MRRMRGLVVSAGPFAPVLLTLALAAAFLVGLILSDRIAGRRP